VVKAQQGKLGEAIRLIRQAIAQDAQASFNLGNALQALDRHEEGISRFERAVELVPDHAEARNNLGKSLFALGRHREAIAEFGRSLASNPRYADAEHNLANALEDLGHHSEALVHAQRALALKPDFSKAHNVAGNALHRLNRLDEAAGQFERAITLEPRYAEAHYNLASLLKDLGRREESSRHFERALSVRRDLAEARFGRCMIELPILYHDEAEIAERRSAYQRQLLALRRDVESGAIKGDMVAALGAHLPFYLAYQGFNDRELQRLWGCLVHDVVAARYPSSPGLARPMPTERIRIGIVSGSFIDTPSGSS
jgi:tetratricopeptide (TPR) repeat protein